MINRCFKIDKRGISKNNVLILVNIFGLKLEVKSKAI